MKKYAVLFLSCSIFAHAQFFHCRVTSTNDSDATAYNNGHHLSLCNGDGMSDTMFIFYHSSDTVYCVTSFNMGRNWQAPEAIASGKYPATDVGSYGVRRLAWQQWDSVGGQFDIFYDRIGDTMPPINVSQSSYNSIRPDMAVHVSGAIGITWTEEVGGKGNVYYRQFGENLSDTVRLSDRGDNRGPSICYFNSMTTPHVLWSCYDSASATPYAILRRSRPYDWSSIDTLAKNYRPLRHSAFDILLYAEPVSACWEDSSSGNLEAFFYQGNPGGNMATYGRSQYPVISTIGSTWSYLFWAEDSAGYRDIFYNLYYNGSWYAHGSLRQRFNITQPVRFPSCSGAYLIWTQGAAPPYDLYFADFGYPIGIAERGDDPRDNFLLGLNMPNPTDAPVRITYFLPQEATVSITIYDLTGQAVKTITSLRLAPGDHATSWDLKDLKGKLVPAGVYFCRLDAGAYTKTGKIVVLN
jgi:hypothetical protein